MLSRLILAPVAVVWLVIGFGAGRWAWARQGRARTLSAAELLDEKSDGKDKTDLISDAVPAPADAAASRAERSEIFDAAPRESSISGPGRVAYLGEALQLQIPHREGLASAYFVEVGESARSSGGGGGGGGGSGSGGGGADGGVTSRTAAQATPLGLATPDSARLREATPLAWVGGLLSSIVSDQWLDDLMGRAGSGTARRGDSTARGGDSTARSGDTTARGRRGSSLATPHPDSALSGRSGASSRSYRPFYSSGRGGAADTSATSAAASSAPSERRSCPAGHPLGLPSGGDAAAGGGAGPLSSGRSTGAAPRGASAVPRLVIASGRAIDHRDSFGRGGADGTGTGRRRPRPSHERGFGGSSSRRPSGERSESARGANPLSGRQSHERPDSARPMASARSSAASSARLGQPSARSNFPHQPAAAATATLAAAATPAADAAGSIGEWIQNVVANLTSSSTPAAGASREAYSSWLDGLARHLVSPGRHEPPQEVPPPLPSLLPAVCRQVRMPPIRVPKRDDERDDEDGGEERGALSSSRSEPLRAPRRPAPPIRIPRTMASGTQGGSEPLNAPRRPAPPLRMPPTGRHQAGVEPLPAPRRANIANEAMEAEAEVEVDAQQAAAAPVTPVAGGGSTQAGAAHTDMAVPGALGDIAEEESPQGPSRTAGAMTPAPALARRLLDEFGEATALPLPRRLPPPQPPAPAPAAPADAAASDAALEPDLPPPQNLHEALMFSIRARAAERSAAVSRSEVAAALTPQAALDLDSRLRRARGGIATTSEGCAPTTALSPAPSKSPRRPATIGGASSASEDVAPAQEAEAWITGAVAEAEVADEMAAGWFEDDDELMDEADGAYEAEEAGQQQPEEEEEEEEEEGAEAVTCYEAQAVSSASLSEEHIRALRAAFPQLAPPDPAPVPPPSSAASTMASGTVDDPARGAIARPRNPPFLSPTVPSPSEEAVVTNDEAIIFGEAPSTALPPTQPTAVQAPPRALVPALPLALTSASADGAPVDEAPRIAGEGAHPAVGPEEAEPSAEEGRASARSSELDSYVSPRAAREPIETFRSGHVTPRGGPRSFERINRFWQQRQAEAERRWARQGASQPGVSQHEGPLHSRRRRQEDATEASDATGSAATTPRPLAPVLSQPQPTSSSAVGWFTSLLTKAVTGERPPSPTHEEHVRV